MKKLLIFFLSVSIAMSASSQDFFKQYLSVDSISAQKFEHVEYSTTDNVYYAVGSSGNFASIFKIDLNGDVICSSTYGTGRTAASFYDFVFAPGGELIVVGVSSNPANNGINDVIIYRINSSLNPVWNTANNVLTNSSAVMGTNATRVVRPRIVGSNGDFVVSFLSDVNGTGTGASDKFSMIAIDVNGAEVWRSQFGTTGMLNNFSPLPDDQIYDMISVGNVLAFVGNIAQNGPNGVNRNAYAGVLNAADGMITGPNQWQYQISNNAAGSRFHEIKNNMPGLAICGSDINHSVSGNGIIGPITANPTTPFYRNTAANTTLSSFVRSGTNIVATTNANLSGNAEVYVFGQTFLGGNVSDQFSFEIVGFSLPGDFKLTTAPGNRVILYGNDGVDGTNAIMTVFDPLNFIPDCNFVRTDRAFQQINIPFGDLARDQNFNLGLMVNQDNTAACQTIADASACPCPCPAPGRQRLSDRDQDEIIGSDSRQDEKNTDVSWLFSEKESGADQMETFKIFPNPTAGQFEILLEKEHGGSEINIFDTKGVLVKRINLDKTDTVVRVNLANVQDGLYVIQIKLEKGVVGSQKVYIGKP